MVANKPVEDNEEGEGSRSNGEQQLACGFYYGALCPRCKQGTLDYNGMLNLQCPVCGLESGYGFT